MKQFFAILLCTALLLSLSACGGTATATESSTNETTPLLTESGWMDLPDSSAVAEESDTSAETASVSASTTVTTGKSANTSTTATNSTPTASSSTASTTTTTAALGSLQLKYIPKYAKGFTIEYYYGGAKIIATDIKATSNTLAFSQRVLILPAGATKPIGATWDHEIEGTVTSAVTMSSSHAGHFGNLNAIGVVKGTSIKAESCFIPSLKDALTNGNTQYVGAGSSANKELIVSLKPQVVFIGGMQTDIDLAQKLEESGLFCFYFGDFAEAGYMGRAEWIELIGTFIGKEQKAQDFIKNSESEINKIIARAAKIKDKPKVLWFTYNSSAPHWYLRTSSDYANSIVSALGGQLYFPAEASGTSIKLSNEDFLQYMLGADKIIFGASLNSYIGATDITYFNKEGQVDFSTSPAYQHDECYVVGYDWAQDTANALSIIQSMAVCLYPDEFADLTNTTKIIKF